MPCMLLKSYIIQYLWLEKLNTQYTELLIADTDVSMTYIEEVPKL